MQQKMIKTRQTSGADERTASLPQYFSWINNTNEGATEEHTLVNLAYFKWLYDYFGMKIRIYALDAGNLDGAWGTYEGLNSEKLKKQYPHGYTNIAEKAAEFGCGLGVWAGADGFGDTPEEEQARFDLFVGLCKDHGFMLFKFDTVCGMLREHKRSVFKRMIDTCRQYNPELIVLNHRNELGEAEICATTFLWQGGETYIDVFLGNRITAMHHRAGAFERGLVPDMQRLTEDHGVCLSSYLDYFEDELILQAFNRALILAPEIYGNPWFLRDDEQARLARIYNLCAKYAEILVDGFALPEAYGEYAVSRGSDTTRLITLRNASWEDKTVTVHVNETIGLAACGKVRAVKYHPYEAYLGAFNYGDSFDIVVPAFRSMLLGLFEETAFTGNTYALTECEYEVVREQEGRPVEIRLYKTTGKTVKLIGREEKEVLVSPPVYDFTHQSPVFLGEMRPCPVPENAEQLYEATMFVVNNDSFESQSVKRSGVTNIPQVKRARDAFFAQKTYLYRGCESKSLFDGDRDTFFDANTRNYGTRIDGGCLRADFGAAYEIGRVEITYFSIDTPVYEVPEQLLPVWGELSDDLTVWAKSPLVGNKTQSVCKAPIVKHSVHNIVWADGTRKTAVYSPERAVKARYFRLPGPMDRMYALKIFDAAGSEIKIDPSKARANNMMAHYRAKAAKSAQRADIKLPEAVEDGDYIAVAVNGEHGNEAAYCAAWDEATGAPVGFTDRAVSYPVNNWEHIACKREGNYTYYLPLARDDAGKTFTFYTLLTKPSGAAGVSDVSDAAGVSDASGASGAAGVSDASGASGASSASSIKCDVYFCKGHRRPETINL